ncbi:MAG: hypothetical protein MRY74_01830 [Neomegalonema sp.]|nr:hypothetical protein [Neomegalonema sp.]
MSVGVAGFVQPALTLCAFGAGCSVATASARLAAEGASTASVWLVGGVAGAALVGASYMMARPASAIGGDADEPVEDPLEDWGDEPIDAAILEAVTAAKTKGASTEERADEDWEAIASGDDQLRRAGLAVGDTVGEEKR